MGINDIIFLSTEATKQGLDKTMDKALLNTVLSIAIVFAVLILISFIISLFKYINRFETARKRNLEVGSNITPVDQETVVEEEVIPLDDLELIAVITAAIEAYEASKGNPIPANGLYVRSIRKINKSRWQKA